MSTAVFDHVNDNFLRLITEQVFAACSTLRTRRAIAVAKARVADERRQRGEAVAEDGAA